jgi:TusA-related sulfurtransferase
MRHKPDRTIDLTLQHCPFTILETGKTLKTMQSGQILEILSDSESLVGDLEAWCEGIGEELLGAETGEIIRIYVRKR